MRERARVRVQERCQGRGKFRLCAGERDGAACGVRERAIGITSALTSIPEVRMP